MSERNQPHIRWRDQDLKELRRLVKNYNAKLRREKAKLLQNQQRFDASFLPDKASVRALRKELETRKDFNKELARMQNFITTGMPYKVNKNMEKSLQATVRDVNKTIDKLEKAYPGKAGENMRGALPERISTDFLLSMSKTPEQLKQNIQDYKRFVKDKASQQLVQVDDNKNGIYVTQWELDLYNERKEAINARRQEEKEKWLKTEKAGTGKTFEELGIEVGDVDDFEYITWSSKNSDRRAKFRTMMRESNEDYFKARTELARIDYLKELEPLIEHSAVGKRILKKIQDASNDDFYRALKGHVNLWTQLYELKYAASKDTGFDDALRGLWNEWMGDEDMDDYIETLAERVE